MSYRLRQGAVLILSLVLTIPAIVWAGGWAVVTLDALPAGVVAERPFTVGFMVRQHGQHPTSGLTPTITAVHTESGESITVSGEEAGQDGHYTAIITLPSAGRWRWHVNAFGFDQPMPEIVVQTSGPQPLFSSGSSSPVLPLPMLAAASLVLATGFLVVWWRTRRRPALVLFLLAAVVGGFALAISAQHAKTAVAQSARAPVPETLSPVAQGEALFVAKGCVMCHVNQRSIVLHAHHIGPSLTDYRGSPGYLRSWLADPPAMKPKTRMPDLHLSDTEIEALIAFLTVETAVNP